MAVSAAPALRSGRNPDGTPITQQQREELLKPLLPRPRPAGALSTDKTSSRTSNTPATALSSTRLRSVSELLIYRLTFYLIQLTFSIYIHARHLTNSLRSRAWNLLYYHHHSPELIRRDVANLSRFPRHLSVVVDLRETEDRDDGEDLSRLLSDLGELCAWCACVGIPLLSIYERTGALKRNERSLEKNITRKMGTFYPPGNTPPFSISIPPQSPQSTTTRTQTPQPTTLNIVLLSMHDGRETLVDLTKTLVEMSHNGKFKPSDITVDLLDAEITASTGGEPDLVLIMTSAHNSGDVKSKRVPKGLVLNGMGRDFRLQGYPPWQVRLTEIFYRPDGSGVDYETFIKALYRFAKAEMRLGR